jgi:hypothetical protein
MCPEPKISAGKVSFIEDPPGTPKAMTAVTDWPTSFTT